MANRICKVCNQEQSIVSMLVCRDTCEECFYEEIEIFKVENLEKMEHIHIEVESTIKYSFIYIPDRSELKETMQSFEDNFWIQLIEPQISDMVKYVSEIIAEFGTSMNIDCIGRVHVEGFPIPLGWCGLTLRRSDYELTAKLDK